MSVTPARYIASALSVDIWGVASVFLWLSGSSLFWIAVGFAINSLIVASIHLNEMKK